MWTWWTLLKSPESRPCPTRRSWGRFGLDERNLSWSCTRCQPTDFAQALSPSPSLPRWTWTWTRGTWFEVVREGKQVLQGEGGVLTFLQVQLQRNVTRRVPSTPRQWPRWTCLPPSQHCSGVRQVHIPLQKDLWLVLQQHQSPQLQGRSIVLWGYWCFLPTSDFSVGLEVPSPWLELRTS